MPCSRLDSQGAGAGSEAPSSQPLLFSDGRPVPLSSPARRRDSAAARGNGLVLAGERVAAHRPRRRVCLLPCPAFGCRAVDLARQREAAVYVSGALFAIGWWLFIDAAVLAGLRKVVDTHWGVEDYVPGVCVTLGMFVVNSVDRSRLHGDQQARELRLLLFIGMALLAGGLAGSLSVLTIKYLVPGISGNSAYYGFAVVIQSTLIMISSIVLWYFVESDNSDYEYSLGL